jgi:predicted secreted hydrolase
MNRPVTASFLLLIIAGVVGIGFSQLRGRTPPTYTADVIAALSSGDTSGFARAVEVKPFVFPQAFGAHPDFQTEWWYYTGNLATADGRRFGYQFTIFRRALEATQPVRQSAWATNQLYFAHFAVSDLQRGRFYDGDRYSRGAGGLAGATVEANGTPSVRVWIEDWTMTGLNPDATLNRLVASAVYQGEPFKIDLTVRQLKPATLQGDRGLSAKSPEIGNASYYYSLTRLETEGTIRLNNDTFAVKGFSWKDHEYSTSVLSKNAIGWDWFSLQLDDGRELMLYRIRRGDGTFEPTSDGSLVYADGTYEHLTLSQYQIEELVRWTSPISGAIYPAKWRITVTPKVGDSLMLTVEPLMNNQEINSSGTGTYWEGANRVTGEQGGQALTGYGYVELTGYKDTRRPMR